MRVYVAVPYSSAPFENIRKAVDAADALLAAGHFPYVPHLQGFWNFIYPHDYETWMAIDFEWLRVSQAMLLIPGNSPGAVREVALADKLCIPVYHRVEDVK